VEFTSYKTAFDESQNVSNQIIDRLATAERLRRKEALTRKPETLVGKFDPDRAYILASNEDPPLAAAYRKSIKTINEYNEIMYAFAIGDGFDKRLAAFDALLAETLGLVSVVLKKPLNLRGADKVIRTGIGQYAGFRSRQVFRDKFQETSPIVLELIAVLRAETPAVFRELIARNDTDQETLDERILISDWVVLMDRHAELLRRTQQAIDTPNFSAGVAGATESIAELRLTVQTIRIHLNEVNGG
jgi:hypothetical protein